MTKVPISEARDRLPDLANRAALRGERTVIERRGKRLCAVVPIEDLDLLEAAEDAHWLAEVRKARAALKRRGEQPVPWEQAKAELDL